MDPRRSGKDKFLRALNFNVSQVWKRNGLYVAHRGFDVNGDDSK
jgi:hypothetical protein